ncbi:GntR family transcriptional regulator [Nocardia macrotermitis]|uniref:Mannosyl-D-glycerate transport/metabolism system repressor MngR n=1 Tax=Nocardia macrotermitis TaxID=2585198 RepID=A0A7K0CWF8_9NOCA|nr:GntR family transcriptional regulator [Nocardia macrotermitis]MQY17840.1 Mannosyl-D-glycerate transport/metabolism system repressor MngR [Nocardia macrotermitis]
MSSQPTPLRAPVRRADRARQVADVLRQQIHAETFAHTLPSEGELAAEFAVSRNTVRDALALLKDEGLIERAPKVGTHVAQRKYEHGIDTLRGLKETLREHGEVRNEVRVATTVTPPPAVARRLDLNPGEQAVYIERLRFLGELPLSLDLTYLAPDIGAQVITRDLERNDVFALIEEIGGGPLGSADLVLEAITADPHSAAALQMPEDGALLLLERLTRLDDGRPVDLEYIRFRGDRITMRGSLVRPAESSDWRLI